MGMEVMGRDMEEVAIPVGLKIIVIIIAIVIVTITVIIITHIITH